MIQRIGMVVLVAGVFALGLEGVGIVHQQAAAEAPALDDEGKKAIPAPPDVEEPPEDAEKTDSGLAYKVLEEGEGEEHPKATDRVKCHYTGWTTDGKMFDSSVARGEALTFPLNRVIPGWTEGVQLMVEGEKTRFWIPAELAYGDEPKRKGAPAGMLVFDIELLEIR
ncbi:MAG: FKBP-type peptidyl-prolyl cis-trans isomerase [Myxococcota bacterium]